MKKKVLIVLFPLLLIVAGSLAVLANGQVESQPGCANCAKPASVPPCCAKEQKPQVQEGCAKCAKLKASDAQQVVDAKVQTADAKPAGAGCPKCAKLQAQKSPCCNKEKAEGQAAVKPCCQKANQ